MRNLVASIAAGLFLCAPMAARAEEGWQWEVAGDFAFPTGKLGPSKLKNGLGFDATITYGITPRIGTYFGWNWHRFRADPALTGAKIDVHESGFVLGAQWRDRLAQTGLEYRIRGGVLLNRLELEDSQSAVIGDSGYGAGWELGAALLVPFGGHWIFTPGIKYRSLSRDLKPAGQNQPVDLRYFSVGAGISVRF